MKAFVPLKKAAPFDVLLYDAVGHFEELFGAKTGLALSAVDLICGNSMLLPIVAAIAVVEYEGPEC